MSRTAIEIAKEASKLPEGSHIVVTPEEKELLDAVASEDNHRQYCTRVNGADVYVRRRNGDVHKACSGSVWATHLEYTGD